MRLQKQTVSSTKQTFYTSLYVDENGNLSNPETIKTNFYKSVKWFEPVKPRNPHKLLKPSI